MATTCNGPMPIWHGSGFYRSFAAERPDIGQIARPQLGKPRASARHVPGHCLTAVSPTNPECLSFSLESDPKFGTIEGLFGSSAKASRMSGLKEGR